MEDLVRNQHKPDLTAKHLKVDQLLLQKNVVFN